jgi:RHS repeat-associated protein
MPVAMKMGGATYYLSYDQVGTLRVVAAGSGNVVKRITYDSFGNILEDTNPSFTMPFGFAGGLHDRDTGLVRFGYRDYDPEVGRWTAKDPIGFDGRDTDLYGYVVNNPVNFIDPEGKIFNVIAAGFGAIVGGVINAAYAYSKGESELNGFAVGALAGALSGLTLNPFLVGAIVGAANSAGNIAAGIDNPCNAAKAIVIGALTGALVGGISGTAGEAMAPQAPEIGAAVGVAAGASLANAAQGFIQFWQDF